MINPACRQQGFKNDELNATSLPTGRQEKSSFIIHHSI